MDKEKSNPDSTRPEEEEIEVEGWEYTPPSTLGLYPISGPFLIRAGDEVTLKWAQVFDELCRAGKVILDPDANESDRAEAERTIKRLHKHLPKRPGRPRHVDEVMEQEIEELAYRASNGAMNAYHEVERQEKDRGTYLGLMGKRAKESAVEHLLMELQVPGGLFGRSQLGELRKELEAFPWGTPGFNREKLRSRLRSILTIHTRKGLETES